MFVDADRITPISGTWKCMATDKTLSLIKVSLNTGTEISVRTDPDDDSAEIASLSSEAMADLEEKASHLP